MQDSNSNSFWDQYEHSLSLVRYSVIAIQIAFVMIRLYIMKMPSFVCLLEMMMIMLLSFMNLKEEAQRQAKLYIILNLMVIGFLALNFLESFSAGDVERILYEENFSGQLKQILYPVQILVRSVFLVVGWRIYQYSIMKHLYLQPPEESEAASSN